MKVMLAQSPIKSDTLEKMLEWIDVMGDIMNTPECPFNSIDELAMQLEKWRYEYQSNCGNESTRKEDIKVMTYQNTVVLICKELTGEYIKLTVTL